MKKQSLPSERDLNPDSVQRRTELFIKYIVPHKRLVYSICIKYTNDSKDIEDNYSEVLVNFFRYIESYSPKRELKSWIYSVAQRYVFDLNRRNMSIPKRNDNIEVSSLSDEDAADICGNTMGLDNYREHYNDNILEAIDNLPEIHREALLLQQAGYRMDEIVEISYQNGNLKSKNAETIKSRIFLAKKSMRSMLTEDGELKNKSMQHGKDNL